MNVTASKVLLGVSLTAYTWCSWDHLSTSSPAAAPTPKTREITAAMVSRAVKLEVVRDPFGSQPLPGSGATPGVLAAGAAGSAAGGTDQSPTNVNYQGSVLAPGQRAAIINGKIINEGELSSADSGPAVHVLKVGPDFVVIQGATGPVVLRLEEEIASGRKRAAQEPAPAGPGLGQPARRSLASTEER